MVIHPNRGTTSAALSQSRFAPTWPITCSRRGPHEQFEIYVKASCGTLCFTPKGSSPRSKEKPGPAVVAAFLRLLRPARCFLSYCTSSRQLLACRTGSYPNIIRNLVPLAPLIRKYWRASATVLQVVNTATGALILLGAIVTNDNDKRGRPDRFLRCGAAVGLRRRP